MASPLPRILCLHGGGTSGEIFQFQTRYIQKAMENVYEFVFVDAPFESDPGPGVLPVFEGMGPFFSWITQSEDEDGSLVAQVIREKLDERGGPFIGVLGFSQGARVAAGLLLEQQEAWHRQGKFTDIDFHFGILLMASCPPLLPSFYTAGPASKPTKEEQEAGAEKYAGTISIPSIHVYGRQDAIITSSKLLTKCFDPKTVNIFEFDVDHYLPRGDGDNKQIADAVLTISQSRM